MEDKMLLHACGKGQKDFGSEPTLTRLLRLKTHRSKKSPNDEKKRGGGFSKICNLSPQLQKFFGVSEMARTEVHCTYMKLWGCYVQFVIS